MIEFLAGTLEFKEPTRAVINVQGVGYEVFISVQTFDTLPELRADVMLFTHLHVREDAMLLYGFAETSERSAFRLLMSVSGVGAKVALAVLSGASVAQLAEYVGSGNISALTSIPGIGKKTAERIIVELRDKLGKEISAVGEGSAGKGDARSEALLALLALGYPQKNAENALNKAFSDDETDKNDVSGLIKLALRLLTR